MSLLKKRKRVVGMRSLVTAVEALTDAVRHIQAVLVLRASGGRPLEQAIDLSLAARQRVEAALGLRDGQ